MPTRTAKAIGTIKNTGTKTITFSAHLTFGGVSSPRAPVTLAAQATSSPITLTVIKDVAYGATETAGVFLHRVDPSPQDFIGASPTTSWTESHLLTGEWSGTPTISRRALRMLIVGEDVEGMFQVSVGQGGGFPTSLLVGVGALAGIVVLGLMQRGRGR